MLLFPTYLKGFREVSANLPLNTGMIDEFVVLKRRAMEDNGQRWI